MSPAATLTVNREALAGNLRVIEAACGAEVAPVVKADAYGLGLPQVLPVLLTCGARAFFVARAAEGERLREMLGGHPAEIFVLDGVAPGRAARLRAADLIPVLNDAGEADVWRTLGEGRPCAVHVDTGLNRLGFRPEQAADLAHAGGLSVTLVMSHLACGSEPEHPLNRAQLDSFRSVRSLFANARASFANSAGAFLGSEYGFDLARPGVSLWGGGPFERPDPRIAAVATFTAPILQVRRVPPGESVGYGASYTADRDRDVAIVGVGYADGVMRSAFPRGAVWFDRALRPLLGRVSMDLIAVDVTGCPAAKPGEVVELFGANLPVDDAAAAAGTIAYELLTSVGARVARVAV